MKLTWAPTELWRAIVIGGERSLTDFQTTINDAWVPVRVNTHLSTRVFCLRHGSSVRPGPRTIASDDAGALYLLYLGIQTVRQKEDFELQAADTDTNTGDSYWRGIMVNTLNPRVAIFFLAFLSQFVTPGSGTWLDMLCLGVLYTTLTLLFLGLLTLTASRIKTMLTTHPRATDVIRWAAGSVIVGFGIELVVSDKPVSH